MTKSKLFVLCASLCLSLSSMSNEAQAQTDNKETHTASALRPSTDPQGKQGKLLADKLEIKKRLSNTRRQRDAELREREEREALEAPCEEIYGDDSWGSHVNPFAGMDVNVPDNYDIDLDGFVMPIERRQITSHYGYRRKYGRMHYGTDLALSVGDTVRATFSGKVRIASYEGKGYGNYIVIRHPNGLETVYGHLHRRFATEGTIVKAGDPIGLGGNTGRSSGPHLHFEARFMGIPLNPVELFDFELGAPRLDSYAFVKSDYRRATGHARQHMARSKAKAGSSREVKIYRVQKGDTLSKIAANHGISVSKLRKLNALRNDRLQIGKSLRIS